MFVDVMLLIVAGIVGYFIGTINFSKIIAWHARKKDITKLGSKNPGAMNMLRSFGVGLAFLTFIAEVVKAGLVCLCFKLLYQHFGIWGGGDFVYYLVGFCLMIGYNFPVWSKFKGGKGVACFSGIFIFSPIWYVSLGWFVVCFILFILIDIGSVISFTYTGGLTIATTVFTWLTGTSVWVSSYITVIVWALFILTLIRHKANIKRLIAGTENKVGFKSKLKKVFCHNKGEQIIDEAEVNNENEAEIVIVEQNDYQNAAENVETGAEFNETVFEGSETEAGESEKSQVEEKEPEQSHTANEDKNN